MTLHVFDEVEQGSEEWLQLRLGILTASVIGDLITAKTLKPADNDRSRALTAQLVGERITGWADPTYINADMQRGHDIEPIARDWYAETRDVNVTEVGFMVLEQNGYRLGYSPDGLVGETGLIEVKAPRAKGHLLTHLNGAVPSHHLPQIHAGLLVSGRDWCDFISYYAGMPPFIKRVHRDDRWDRAVIAAAEQFEQNAMEMQSQFQLVTEGLPATERLPQFEEIVI